MVLKNHEQWHGVCTLIGMKDVVTRERRNIERACATWDWVRTAGVSADELRKALMEERKPEAEKNRGRTPEPAVAS